MGLIEADPSYRVLTSRSSLTGTDGLTAINTWPLNQGCLILASGSIYRLDRASAAVVDGVTVLAPVTGPGRWLFVASGGGATVSVANIAALSALGASSPDLVWVESLRCYWHRRPTSTATVDGITIVAAVGGGRWERIVATTAQDWQAQATWYLDSTVGLDENPGTAALPLATFTELERRLSTGPLQQATTVWVGENSSYNETSLEVDLGNLTSTTLSLRGVPHTLATDTFTAVTTRDHVTPEGTLIEGTTIVDWSPWENFRIRVTSGAASGAVAWVAAANPDGAGLDVARTSIFAATTDPLGPVVTETEPTAGETFVMEELPQIRKFSLITRNGMPTGYRCYVADLEFGSLTLGSPENYGTPYVLDGLLLVSGLAGDNPSTTWIECFRSLVRGPVQVRTFIHFALFDGSSCSIMRDSEIYTTLCQGGGGYFLGWDSDPCSIIFDDCQVFDATIGIQPIDDTQIRVVGSLSGKGNTAGLLLDPRSYQMP
jgi:hypothetical protein